MGQHKHNPTAIAAKNGEIKPKEKSTAKRLTINDLLKEAASEFKVIDIPFYRYIHKTYM